MLAKFPKTAFVGRQPIYNCEMQVVAYELLFRGGEFHTSAEIIDADKATSQVLLNTFLEFGLDNIVGELPAFINLSRGFLLGHYQLSLPPDRVVLEVLEGIVVSEELITSLRSLSKQGYTIALDDFIYEQRYRELVDIANIVKIDLLMLTKDTLKEHVRLLRQHEVKLVAEKVETQDDFEFCRALGFDYYQGFFFAKPKTLGAQCIPINRLAVLRILAELQNP
jgi:EAL and modified HD-GYP domain-containing signal transduction protein